MDNTFSSYGESYVSFFDEVQKGTAETMEQCIKEKYIDPNILIKREGDFSFTPILFLAVYSKIGIVYSRLIDDANTFPQAISAWREKAKVLFSYGADLGIVLKEDGATVFDMLKIVADPEFLNFCEEYENLIKEPGL